MVIFTFMLVDVEESENWKHPVQSLYYTVLLYSVLYNLYPIYNVQWVCFMFAHSMHMCIVNWTLHKADSLQAQWLQVLLHFS